LKLPWGLLVASIKLIAAMGDELSFRDGRTQQENSEVMQASRDTACQRRRFAVSVFVKD
jgi:hypothetical protein